LHGGKDVIKFQLIIKFFVGRDSIELGCGDVNGGRDGIKSGQVA